MKNYNILYGLAVSALVAIAILPIRIAEGQGENVLNLVGSEIIIMFMCFISWCATHYILGFQWRKWHKLLVSLLVCAVTSNIVYYLSNPFFEDYPLSPIIDLPLKIGILRLALRGLLMGLIIVPIAFLMENERYIYNVEMDAQKLRLRTIEEQKILLEAKVSERTKSLEDTLSLIKNSKTELDKQVFLLSQLVASITHDVSSPLNYVIIVAKKISQMLESGQPEDAVRYHRELLKSLVNMSDFMKNHLEFTKTQVRGEVIPLSNVNLSVIVSEKVRLLEGIIIARKNAIHVDVDKNLTFLTNKNLLAVILHNLLENAARYTYEGVISVTAEITDGKLKLKVANTIREIPEFFLSNSGNTKNEENTSTGIGMILVRNIADLLDIDFIAKIDSGMAVAQLDFGTVDPNNIQNSDVNNSEAEEESEVESKV